MAHATSDPPWLLLPTEISEVLRPTVPDVVESIIEVIPLDVPVYAMPMEGRFGQGVRQGVQIALNRFLDLPGTRLPALSPEDKWVYERLGGGEVRSGRSLESLLAAYRSGARVTFRRHLPGRRHDEPAARRPARAGRVALRLHRRAELGERAGLRTGAVASGRVSSCGGAARSSR